MASCSTCKRETSGGYKHKTPYECYLKAEEFIQQQEDRITELETELAEAYDELDQHRRDNVEPREEL